MVKPSLPLQDVADFEAALLGALPITELLQKVPAQAVLMEAVTTHEMDRREGEAVEALNAVAGLECLGLRLELPIVVSAFVGLFGILGHDLSVLVDGCLVLLEFVQEELLDVLVLDVLVLGQDRQDQQWRQGMNLLQVLQDFGNEGFSLILWLGEVLEGMNPQIDFFTTVELAQLNYFLVVSTANVKIQEIVSHFEQAAQIYDTLVELVHLEQDQQVVAVVLPLLRLQVFHNLVLVG